MSNNIASLEALLFVSGKPISFKFLSQTLNVKENEVKEKVKALQDFYQSHQRGLSIITTDTTAQLFSAPEQQEVVQGYLEAETHADLTRPQLETLSIIAYRGPIIKEILEQIRGVNCSMILRNLLIRGLVYENETATGITYTVTEDFLSHLGVNDISELPDYAELNQHEYFEQI